MPPRLTAGALRALRGATQRRPGLRELGLARPVRLDGVHGASDAQKVTHGLEREGRDSGGIGLPGRHSAAADARDVAWRGEVLDVA
ncbi:MAG TPA: hypothetical protein VH062_01410 [Polyangiaceae bacterium]|nr:hypothetical protein [Polyangiaceae bacterium]